MRRPKARSHMSSQRCRYQGISAQFIVAVAREDEKSFSPLNGGSATECETRRVVGTNDTNSHNPKVSMVAKVERHGDNILPR